MEKPGNRHYENEKNLIKSIDKGESSWRSVDFAGEQKREELKEALTEFQVKTGINEKEYLQKLDDCKSNSEIYALEKKFKKAAISWYTMQMKKSGIFEPIDDREHSLINQEMDGLIDWFSGLDLAGDTSMISVLCNLEKDFEVKKSFRNKLSNKSKFVRNEYFRRLGSLPMVGSKEQLLTNVLLELKEVEDAPSAVQYEFKKKQKNAKASQTTAQLKHDINEQFDKRNKKYTNEIIKNKDSFGGKDVNTPYGKLPLTAWEFIQWFEERESFAEMDSAIKKLPSLIKERNNLYNKRDAIVQDALPKDRKMLISKTDNMRRHELEEFLPELKEHVRKNNIHVAEYVATITSARAQNISLFPSFEKVQNIRKFKLADVESQKARIKVLREEIEDRAKVVNEYLNLPSYLRDDQRFINSSSIDREKLLIDAREKEAREQSSPFDTSNDDELTNDDIHEISEALDGYEGQNIVEEIVDEMAQEGLMIAAQIQNQTYWKIFGTARRAEIHKETQKESYLRDLKYWVRLDQNIKDESDVNNERERSKFRYVEAADEAYDLGYVMTSGGIVDELTEIDANRLKNGDTKVMKDLNESRYGEHVKIYKEDGSETRDPLQLIEKLSQQEVLRLVPILITKLARNHMGLSASNTNLLRNSQNIKREIGERIIDQEFNQLKAA